MSPLSIAIGAIGATVILSNPLPVEASAKYAAPGVPERAGGSYASAALASQALTDFSAPSQRLQDRYQELAQTSEEIILLDASPIRETDAGNVEQLVAGPASISAPSSPDSSNQQVNDPNRVRAAEATLRAAKAAAQEAQSQQRAAQSSAPQPQQEQTTAKAAPAANQPDVIHGEDISTVATNDDEDLSSDSFLQLTRGLQPKSLGRILLTVQNVDNDDIYGSTAPLPAKRASTAQGTTQAPPLPAPPPEQRVITLPPPNPIRIMALREAYVKQQQAALQAQALETARSQGRQVQPAGPRAPSSAGTNQAAQTARAAQATQTKAQASVSDRLPGDTAPGFTDTVKPRRQVSAPVRSTPEVKFYRKLSRVDRDKNGVVSRREYVIFHLSKFKRFDLDGNSTITLDEIFYKRSKQKAKKLAKQLLKRLDINKDRRVTRDEARTVILTQFYKYDLDSNGIVEIGKK